MAQYSRVCALAHLHAEEWTVNIFHAKNPFFKVSKWTFQARNNIAFWIYPVLFSLLSAKGCLRLQELELDRAILINEEIAHAMCLCGLRGLETISFTFTPVSPGAIKELLGKSTLISYLVLISLPLLLHVNLIWKKGKIFRSFFVFHDRYLFSLRAHRSAYWDIRLFYGRRRWCQQEKIQVHYQETNGISKHV